MNGPSGMIREVSGNLLRSDAEALVNTVNCVGVMGKGIALQFKKAFPENFKVYKRACDRHEVRPGEMLVVPIGMEGPRYVINFPTKRHWKGKTRIEDVQVGLRALVREIKQLDIKSVAVPPLGCGHGGLQWDDVRPLMLQAFMELPDVDVRIYPPGHTPDAHDIVVAEKKPKMTRGRALLVSALGRYGVLAAEAGDTAVTHVEIQKLAYFMQSAGEEMNLDFAAHHYGPYSDKLRKALRSMDMHYIVGYGDGSAKRTEIRPLPQAVEAAAAYLDGDDEAASRLERVIELASGFQSPYGMELLSTVHWVAAEQGANSVDEAVESVQKWSERKKAKFPPDHIVAAWRHLAWLGWIGERPAQLA